MALNRRRFLKTGLGAGALVAGGVTVGVVTRGDSEAEPDPSTDPIGPRGAAGEPIAVDGTPGGRSVSTTAGGRWSDPSTWEDGRIPGADTAVEIVGPVALDAAASVSQLDIAAQGALSFASQSDVTLASSGNIVVRGLLTAEPATPAVRHLVRFVGVDEASFAGGGMAVQPTDVGLWVTEGGRLDLTGSARRGWVRSTVGLPAGTTVISVASLDAPPDGWQVGDEIAVTPTAPPSEPEPVPESEVRVIVAVGDDALELDRPLDVDHPLVDVGPAGSLGPEIANLTRNINIEGTEEGRAHVIIVGASSAQSLRWVGFRHLGPATPWEENPSRGDAGVHGRYALHFHHCRDGSRGSTLEGLVARDIGNHAFVPHGSHGTTWTDCVTHDTRDTAYWWDVPDPSADTVFDRCLASTCYANADNQYSTAGFLLGVGPAESNVVRNCVATAIEGRGFSWAGGSESPWVFSNCVAHNVTDSGILMWQNNNETHLIADSVSYHNERFGIDHGAYANAFRYENCVTVGNRITGIAVNAVSGPDPKGDGLTFDNCYSDARGAEWAMIIPDGSPIEAILPTRVVNSTLIGARAAGIRIEGEGRDAWAEVVDCSFDGNELWIDDEVGAGSRITLIERGAATLLGPAGAAGTPRPEWNATQLST